MKSIKLTKGLYTKVDNDDYEKLNQYKWCAVKKGEKYYVQRRWWKASTRQTGTIYMHRQILNAPKSSIVDHINGDSLDNRKSNLRITNKSENAVNVKAQRRGKKKSRYRGVEPRGNCFRARITKNGERFELGHFKSEEEAAKAYNKKAKELFGDICFLNKIKEER